MEGNSMPRTIDEVFQDYQNRRAGICKALTNDVEEFHQQCDPEKENLCLYGHPDGNWEVDLPAEEVPPEIPEPALGINFAREGMPRRDWLSLVAVHSDAWLLAVASFYGACFDKQGRKRLFNMINELPTVLEVVTGRKPPKEKTPVSNGSGGGGGSANKSKSSTKMPQRANEAQGKATKQSNLPPPQPREQEEEEEEEEETLEEDEEGEEEHGDTLCGSCGGFYGADEFWICCDLCEVWYHGKCVKITPARAEHIKQYKCPSCQSNKRARLAGM